MLLSTQLYKWEALNLILSAQGGGGGVLGISSDGDDRMELKVDSTIKQQQNMFACNLISELCNQDSTDSL